MKFDEIESTKDIPLSKDPIDWVIGQDHIVNIAKLAAKQRRHLLLVGPPGIGKSMLAQALSVHLPKPKNQISVVENIRNPERPLVEIQTINDIKREKKYAKETRGKVVSPRNVPGFVAERLGFRCVNCGTLSPATREICPRCGGNKFNQIDRNVRSTSEFEDIITEIFEISMYEPEDEVHTTRVDSQGNEELVIYQRIKCKDGVERIRVLDQKTIYKLRQRKKTKRKNVIIPIKRKTFVHATGASETELLGDVRHDPYGGHPEIGIPPHRCVVPGAIHEAHEGVLFIDELPHLGPLQNFILTAMQEKKFSIVGRNPGSSGASVKAEDVPCDFVFIGACNIGELKSILPPLRSRISGGGYELLLNTTMEYSDVNKISLARFVAQEIKIDGKIPHADREAVELIIDIARKKAKVDEKTKKSFTLRLRDLGGVIRFAGDLAVGEGSEFIEKKHIGAAIKHAKPIEYQLKERYGSIWKGSGKDEGIEQEGDGVGRSYR